MMNPKVNELVLNDYMVKNNLSQKDLAEKLGITSGYVCLLLCGGRRPSPALRRRMQELLNMSFDELFCLENGPSGPSGVEPLSGPETPHAPDGPAPRAAPEVPHAPGDPGASCS